MAFEFLLDQGNRIIEATVNNANRHITSLSRALRAQESITEDLLIDLGHSDEAMAIAMDMLASRDTEIIELQARITRLEATLLSERQQHTEVQNELHRRQAEWNTWFHRVKALLPELVTNTMARLNDQVLGILTSAPPLSAPTASISHSDQPDSVPMARQRAQRGHAAPPRIPPLAPTPPAP